MVQPQPLKCTCQDLANVLIVIIELSGIALDYVSRPLSTFQLAGRESSPRCPTPVPSQLASGAIWGGPQHYQRSSADDALLALQAIPFTPGGGGRSRCFRAFADSRASERDRVACQKSDFSPCKRFTNRNTNSHDKGIAHTDAQDDVLKEALILSPKEVNTARNDTVVQSEKIALRRQK